MGSYIVFYIAGFIVWTFFIYMLGLTTGDAIGSQKESEKFNNYLVKLLEEKEGEKK